MPLLMDLTHDFTHACKFKSITKITQFNRIFKRMFENTGHKQSILIRESIRRLYRYIFASKNAIIYALNLTNRPELLDSGPSTGVYQ